VAVDPRRLKEIFVEASDLPADQRTALLDRPAST
jgi:hypothetical protein